MQSRRKRKMSRMRVRGEKILTVICVVLCLLLSLLLIVMSVFYMAMMLRSALNDTEELPSDVLYRLKGGAKDNAEYDLALNLPVFAGFKVDEYGGFTGISDNVPVMYNFFSALGGHIEGVFGPSGSCRSLGKDEGELLWRGCPSHDNYVYLCFDGDIPDYFIRAFYGTDTSASCSGDIGLIHELFLIYEKKADGEYTLSATGRSSSGGIYSYVTGTCYTLEDIVSYYRNSFFSPCEFACDSLSVNDGEYALPLCDTAIIYSYGRRAESIMFCGAELDGLSDRLIELFDYNPNKLNSYTEAGGVQVCIESHGTLRVGSNGFSYTETSGGGIDLSDILGYRENSYSMYDYILCCCGIISDIEEQYGDIFGGEGNVRLKSAVCSDDTVTIDFIYTYSNCDITSNGKNVKAYGFSVKNGKLVSFEAHTLCVKRTGNVYAAYPQNWALERIAENGSGYSAYDCGMLFLGYEIGNYNMTSDTEYTANWCYIPLPEQTTEAENEVA